MHRNREARPGAPWHSLAALLLAASALACGGAGGDQAAGGADTTTPATQVAAAPGGSGGGEQLYQTCATCHQANGEGLTGTFPPLAGSEFATAENVAVPISIILHGMQGPVTVKGQQYNGIMPPFGTGAELSDNQVAQVLTFVRQSWGNNASAITPEQVAEVRAAPRTATGPTTEAELRAMMTGG